MALSIQLIPGYVFAPGEKTDVAKLNQLGRPTVVVSGTVDGATPTAIGDDTITGAKLVGSGGTGAVCDDVTIETNAGSGAKVLRVKEGSIKLSHLSPSDLAALLTADSTGRAMMADGFVTGNKLADSVAGTGLGWNAASPRGLTWLISALTSKATPVMADSLALLDSSDSSNKRATITAIAGLILGSKVQASRYGLLGYLTAVDLETAYLTDLSVTMLATRYLIKEIFFEAVSPIAYGNFAFGYQIRTAAAGAGTLLAAATVGPNYSDGDMVWQSTLQTAASAKTRTESTLYLRVMVPSVFVSTGNLWVFGEVLA